MYTIDIYNEKPILLNNLQMHTKIFNPDTQKHHWILGNDRMKLFS